MRSRAVAFYPFAVAVVLVLGLPGCKGSSSGPTTPPGSLELNSGNIPPGGVYQHAFASAGTFAYHCTIHTAMTGNKVVVDAAAAADSAVVSIVSASPPGYSPSSVTIKPGGHVRWINAHSMTHTVTSGS